MRPRPLAGQSATIVGEVPVSLTDWLRERQQSRREARYTQVSRPAPDVPEGVWGKCEGCGGLIAQAQMERNGKVCPSCGHYYPLAPVERLDLLIDDGTYEEWDAHLVPADPLGFAAAKTYRESVAKARERSGAEEAVVCGAARLAGIPLAIGVMDFRFIGGSMGSVVGEKVARTFERAAEQRLPVLMVCASGGARMQEGMLSLFQMAKTSAAVARYREIGQPYVALLTNPTSGGVTASFATLADIIIAEPKAFIGFAGPRVIEQTIRQKLPKGFQSAEFMLQHGLVDMIVPRDQQRDTLAALLGLLGGGGE